MCNCLILCSFRKRILTPRETQPPPFHPSRHRRRRRAAESCHSPPDRLRSSGEPRPARHRQQPDYPRGPAEGIEFFQGPSRISVAAEAVHHPHLDAHAQQHSHAPHPVRKREGAREGGREGVSCKERHPTTFEFHCSPHPPSFPPSLPLLATASLRSNPASKR